MLPAFEFLTLCLAALVPDMICDYQLEVNLVSYNNSARRLQNGQCCDLESNGVCFPQDTCDVRLTFSVQNFNTFMTFNNQTKVLGPYDNMDTLTFSNCSVLSAMNNDVQNPLRFIIPTSQWNDGQVLRIQALIVDIDQITGTPEQEFILSTSPIAEISRPSAPSTTYTNIQTFNGDNSLTLTFQYRIICSFGTCGSNCSQTTNCLPFSSCVPITCADSLCQNGGTCTLVQGSSFSCACREGFTGPTCGDIVPIISTTDSPSTATTQNVVTSTCTSSSSQDSQPKGTGVQSCPVTAAVVSSIVIFVITALIFLTVGIVIGYFMRKCKSTAKSSSTPDKAIHTAPCARDQPTASVSAAAHEYAPIHVAKGTLVEEHVQGIGMKRNVAYAPSAVNTMATGGQSRQPEEHTYSQVQVSNNYII